MANYTTATLAIELGLGEGKAATRELRKFLRADARAAGKGDTLPGKGGRYSIDLTKPQLRAMGKKLAEWQKAEAEAKAARAAALAAAKGSAPIDDAPEVDSTDEVAGPSDEEIAAMLADSTDED